MHWRRRKLRRMRRRSSKGRDDSTAWLRRQVLEGGTDWHASCCCKVKYKRTEKQPVGPRVWHHYGHSQHIMAPRARLCQLSISKYLSPLFSLPLADFTSLTGRIQRGYCGPETSLWSVIKAWPQGFHPGPQVASACFCQGFQVSTSTQRSL